MEKAVRKPLPSEQAPLPLAVAPQNSGSVSCFLPEFSVKGVPKACRGKKIWRKAVLLGNRQQGFLKNKIKYK